MIFNEECESAPYTAAGTSHNYGESHFKQTKPTRKTLSFTPLPRLIKQINNEADIPACTELNDLTVNRLSKRIRSTKDQRHSLELFNEYYDDLLIKLESEKQKKFLEKEKIRRPNKSNFRTTTLSTDNKAFKHLLSCIDDIASFTNTEEISDFYDYTENCMKMIMKLGPKRDNGIKVSFHLDKIPKKRIAIFDLDETLVHCAGQKGEVAQHYVEVLLPTKNKIIIGVNIRPHWKEMIELIQESYHIVIYTASHHSYADAVLDFMDPQKKYFNHRLYRNHCILEEMDGHKFYIKDLSIIDADLKDMVIIDNSVLSFPYQLDNGIPIMPYYDATSDCELIWLGYYLQSIAKKRDLRESNRENIQMGVYLEEARKEAEKSEKDCIVSKATLNKDDLLFYRTYSKDSTDTTE